MVLRFYRIAKIKLNFTLLMLILFKTNILIGI